MTIMIKKDEIDFEKVYENVRYVAPIYEDGIVYGKLVLEDNTTATFNMDEYDFFDLTPRKIDKFTSNFIYG